MAITTVELFRASNKTSPRLDYLRPGEVVTYSVNGVDWVTARSGGASTLERQTALRGTWWRLPVGTQYDDSVIFLWNDYDDHWSWEPIRDMPLSVFTAALTAVNPKFIRV